MQIDPNKKIWGIGIWHNGWLISHVVAADTYFEAETEAKKFFIEHCKQEGRSPEGEVFLNIRSKSILDLFPVDIKFVEEKVIVPPPPLTKVELLMKEIIEKKDRNVFRKNLQLFSEAEKKYIKEKLLTHNTE